jgi:hypothetical protein
MDVERNPLHNYAPALHDDDGNEIGFEGMEKIRQPYRRRAVIVALIRSIGLTLSWIALIIAAITYLVKLSLSVFIPIVAFGFVAFFTFSPLLFPWLRLAEGLPPLPLELGKLLSDLKYGTAKAEAGDAVVLTSQFHSPFAVLLSSDLDSDWAMVPDHRLRCLNKPISLRIPPKPAEQSSTAVTQPTTEAEPNDGQLAPEANQTDNHVDGEHMTVAEAKASGISKTRTPKTTWLKEVRWRVAVHKIPIIIRQEGFEGDNAIRVNLALRCARAVLRGKTKEKAGLAGARKVVIAAIEKRLGENGLPMRLGLNGTDSAEWIKQLLIGDYSAARRRGLRRRQRGTDRLASWAWMRAPASQETAH